MDIRRKVQRMGDRRNSLRVAEPREFVLTTMGKGERDECPCPVCDYVKAIGAESEEIDGVTIHRLTEHEMMAVQSMMRGELAN